MRPSTEQLMTFIHVIESGGFSKAAERLNVSRSIVSRRIAQLEDLLSARLVSRSTHIVVPTEIGSSFYQRSKRAIQEIDNAVEYITEATSDISGHVRISAPTTFGAKYLAPTVHEIIQSYPRLEISIALQDGNANPLKNNGVDFAICLGNLEDSSLVAKFFKPVPQTLVCSPTYAAARSLPSEPRDLLHHECLIYNDASSAPQWQFHMQGAWQTIRPNGRLHSNNPEVICEAAEAGLGLAMIPSYVANSALSKGTLISVMPEESLKDLGLFALFPPNPQLPRKVRLVVDFLAKRWRKPLPCAARSCLASD